jgi:hypothetical protein
MRSAHTGLEQAEERFDGLCQDDEPLAGEVEPDETLVGEKMRNSERRKREALVTPSSRSKCLAEIPHRVLVIRYIA